MIDARLDLAAGIPDLAVELADRGRPAAALRGEDRIGVDLVASRAAERLAEAAASVRGAGGAWSAGPAGIALQEPYLAGAVRAALQARDLVRDFVSAPNGAMTAAIDAALGDAVEAVDAAVDGLVWLIERADGGEGLPSAA